MWSGSRLAPRPGSLPTRSSTRLSPPTRCVASRWRAREPRRPLGLHLYDGNGEHPFVHALDTTEPESPVHRPARADGLRATSTELRLDVSPERRDAHGRATGERPSRLRRHEHVRGHRAGRRRPAEPEPKPSAAPAAAKPPGRRGRWVPVVPGRARGPSSRSLALTRLERAPEGRARPPSAPAARSAPPHRLRSRSRAPRSPAGRRPTSPPGSRT